MMQNTKYKILVLVLFFLPFLVFGQSSLMSIKFAPQSSGPSCTTDSKGTIYIGTDGKLYICNGTTYNAALTSAATESMSAAQVSSGIFGSVAGKGNYTFQGAATTNPVLFVDATNERVGIATTTPAYRLDVIGDVRWSGTLQGGSVPWARLTSFPSACPGGQFVTAVGGTLTCSTPGTFGNIFISALDADRSHTIYFNVSGGTGAELTYNVDALEVRDGQGIPQIFLGTDGNVSWTGSLTGGSVPWARVTGFTGDTTNDSWTGTGSVYTTSGNVGIGTSAPLGDGGDLTLGSSGMQGRLYLYGSTAGKYSVIMTTDGNLHIDPGYGTGGSNILYLNWYNGGSLIYGGGAQSTKFRVDTSGNGYFAGDATIAGGDINLAGGARITGSSAGVIQLLMNTTLDTGYEWVGFYSGGTRQGIILYDGAWSGCTNVESDFCFVAENGQRLVLQSGTTQVLINDNLLVGSTGAGKIDVGTVDPLYTINGARYATYLPGITGVKEETTGVIKIRTSDVDIRTSDVDREALKYVIDFNNALEGSDLWLFAQAINIDGRAYIAEDGTVYRTTAEELFDNFSVLLTPNFMGDVWYEKDVANRTITIYGRPTSIDLSTSDVDSMEISYRLTAPRFDWKSWSNISDSEHEGFNLDKLLK